MSKNRTIVLQGVSKKFCKKPSKQPLYGIIDIMKHIFRRRVETAFLRDAEFWAVQDIDFSSTKGEIIGVVGANGSGKSTLFRILAGIYQPEKGVVFVKGSPSFALPWGLSLKMTGRENIYLYGAMRGLSRTKIIETEVVRKVIEISAGENFIDTPIDSYSIGMRYRLVASMIVSFDAEVYLLDEILAGADAGFQKRFIRKVKALAKKEKTVVIASHKKENLKDICNRLIILDQGRIVYFGETREGLDLYSKRFIR